MDSMFQTGELERWLSRNHLTPKWTDGVYERLSSGHIPASSDEAVVMLKSCRIWQLKPGASAWKDLVSFGKTLPEPDIADYAIVYDGQLESNDLEDIYDKFTERKPPGFSGHPLSVSDLVELYADDGSAFFFLDRTCFRQVTFPEQERGFEMDMTM
jgi:hypothetical protein